MFENIKSQVETVTRHSLAIVLSEAEVTEALVNPSKLLKIIRSERAKWHAKPAWSTAGHAGLSPRNGKVKTGKKSAEKKSRAATTGAPQICPHCLESFKRLAKHLPACPDLPTGAGTASAD